MAIEIEGFVKDWNYWYQYERDTSSSQFAEEIKQGLDKTIEYLDKIERFKQVQYENNKKRRK